MPMYVTLVIHDNRIPTEPRDTTLSQEYLACLDDQTTSESFHPRSGRRVGDARRHLTEVNDSGKSKFKMSLLKCVYTWKDAILSTNIYDLRYVYLYIYIKLKHFTCWLVSSMTPGDEAPLALTNEPASASSEPPKERSPSPPRGEAGMLDVWLANDGTLIFHPC